MKVRDSPFVVQLVATSVVPARRVTESAGRFGSCTRRKLGATRTTIRIVRVRRRHNVDVARAKQGVFDLPD